MTDQERTDLKKRIAEETKKLERNIADLEIETAPVSPDNAIGRVSRIDAIQNKSVNEAALLTARNKLVKLNTALTKIDDPRFGICSRCGKPIAVPRLMFLPESTRCINCAD